MDNGLLLKRSEIEEKFKWNLSDIYSSIADWEADFKNANILIDKAAKFKGTLHTSASNFFNALECVYEGQLVVEQLYVYAHLKKDEDNALGESQALTDRAMSLAVLAESTISYLTPEILSIDKSRMDEFFAERVELKKYSQLINEILRLKEYTLSSSEEKLLAMAGEIANAPSSIYSMLCDADMTFPSIKDEKGNTVEMTSGRFIPIEEHCPDIGMT